MDWSKGPITLLGSSAGRHWVSPIEPKFCRSINKGAERYPKFTRHPYLSAKILHQMALPATPEFLEYQISLSGLLSSLSPTEFQNLGRLQTLFSWCTQSVNWTFIQAATRFWHPRCHVFRFGLDQLCPTFEEFFAILGFPLLSPPTIVLYDRLSRDVLAEFLGLPASQTRRLTLGGCIDLPAIILLFSHCREYDESYSLYRQHAVILCLTSFLLLVTGAELADSSVVHIALGISLGYSPIPVILAETLNGLDLRRENSGEFQRGSPILLYIWLLEHFQLVVPPVRALPVPDQFFNRFLINTGMETSSQWTRWFANEGIRNIRWHVPWWTLGHPIVPIFPQGFVPLVGLRQTSFYCPQRVFRQFHLFQRISRTDILAGGPEDLSVAISSNWLQDWRALQNAVGSMPWEREQIFPVLNDYLEWLWLDIQNDTWSNVYRNLIATDDAGVNTIFRKYHKSERKRFFSEDNGEWVV